MEKKRLLTYQLLCIALMVVVLVMLLSKPKAKSAEEQKPLTKKEAVLSNIHSRKSVRKFVPQKAVSKEDLTEIVKAGMAAPTAVDKRPWAFVAVTDRAMLDTLATGLEYAQMLKQAGAAIVVCGNLSKAVESHPDYWIQDCSAATENILLAVEAMDLGAVWTGVYPVDYRVKFVKNTLGLPEEIIPLCVIPIGHPDGETKPKLKWDEGNLHWEKWQPAATVASPTEY